MTKKSYILAAALMAAAAMPAAAQTNGSNSPYSRYGFGLLSDGANAFNKGMAGTGYGMRNGGQLNTKNPASYAAIDSLTFLFDFGLSLQNANIAQGSVKTNAKNTSIDYISAGFRMAKGLGMSVGLLPYSTIGYSTSYTSTLSTATGDVTQTNSFSGDGGLHEAYGGLGWAPFKGFSLGANAGYLWGSLEHSTLMTFDDSNINSTRQAYYTDIRTYKVDFGLQYELQLNKKNSLTLGLTYGLGHKIGSKAYFYNQKVSGSSGSVTAGDTLTCNGAYELPHTFGAGLVWSHGNSLRVGADYTFQKWADVRYPSLVNTDNYGTQAYMTTKGQLTDMHQVSLGAEYVPNPNGLRWRQRVRYTAGVSYSTPYITTDAGKGPKHYLASLGVSLPIINMYNNRTRLNIAAQYEHVKPAAPGMIKENYLRLSIGLTFDERWFMKWKAE